MLARAYNVKIGVIFGVRFKRQKVDLKKANLHDKKAVLPQGNRAMLQVFCSVEVRQTHSLQV